MIPIIEQNFNPSTLEEKTYSNRTYRIVPTKSKIQVRGITGGTEALRQTIICILNTERYKFPIYSWNYGVELVSLYGKPMSLIRPELQRRICEALLQDDRIIDVDDFFYEVTDKKKLHATFFVYTIFGDINTSVEVNI